MTNIPLKISPGVVATESIFSEPGRWIDMDKVRFYRGKAQKIGGAEKYGTNQYTGVSRAIYAWSDNSSNILVVVGTHCKLMVYDSELDVTNITPIESTGTLANDPIDTVSGSDEVTITHSSNARSVGDTVIISGAAAVGGLTIDGSYIIQSTPDGNSYTITASSNASSTANGGGASVAYQYELNCGLIDTTAGGGYGVGGYGQEDYGNERQDSDYIQYPRLWSLNSYGEDLIACPIGDGIYRYDTSAGGRAAIVANAPTSNQATFVSEDRHLISLGADGVPMKVKWPDQNDITNWTPSASTTAGERTLQEGSKLVAGAVLQNLVNLIWSDSALYLFQYIGTASTFSSRIAGTQCGLIGPKAFAVVDGVAYWMSRSQFHYYAGYVRKIPNSEDIRDFVMSNIDNLQSIKTFCGYVQEFNEIWWWFVVDGETEPSIYVAFNIDGQFWIKGTMGRSAFTNQESSAKEPLMSGTGDNDYIYTHETGLDDDGSAVNSFMTMAPFAIQTGEKSVDISGYEPDFERQIGDITLTLNTYTHSREASLLDTQVHIITTMTDDVDPRVSGRYLGLTIESNLVGGDFRMGEPKMEIDTSGDRQ